MEVPRSGFQRRSSSSLFFGAVVGDRVVIDGDGEPATGQSRYESGESEQLVEAAFEGGRSLGEMGAEAVPEGLVLDAGVEPPGGVVKRRGARGRPDEDAPEHAGAARGGVAELEDSLAVSDGLGEHDGAGDGTRRVVEFHRTQAPSWSDCWTQPL